MLNAPTGSFPRRMADASNSGEVKLGLFRLVAEILTEQEEDRDIASLGSKRDIKAWIKKRATKEWLLKARACSRLASTYQDVGTLETRGYLSFDFKGRQVLTEIAGRRSDSRGRKLQPQDRSVTHVPNVRRGARDTRPLLAQVSEPGGGQSHSCRGGRPHSRAIEVRRMENIDFGEAQRSNREFGAGKRSRCLRPRLLDEKGEVVGTNNVFLR